MGLRSIFMTALSKLEMEKFPCRLCVQKDLILIRADLFSFSLNGCAALREHMGTFTKQACCFSNFHEIPTSQFSQTE